MASNYRFGPQDDMYGPVKYDEKPKLPPSKYVNVMLKCDKCNSPCVLVVMQLKDVVLEVEPMQCPIDDEATAKWEIINV